MRQPLLRALALIAVVTTHAPAQPRNFDNTQEHLLPVQGNTYMLAGAGGNTTLQVGKDGVLVVDTQYAEMAPKILSEIRKLSDKPIVWMVNTHVDQDHSGGNAALVKLGRGPGPRPRIIAYENVLNRMTQRVPNQPPVPDEALPNDEYGTPQKDLFFNGEAEIGRAHV